jgi:hypothetical protein
MILLSRKEMGLLSSPHIHDFQVVLNGNGEPRRSYVHDRSLFSVQNRARIQTVDFELIHLLTQAEKDVYAHYSIGGEKRYSDIRSFSSTDRLAPVQAESRKENDKAGENERHIPLDICRLALERVRPVRGHRPLPAHDRECAHRPPRRRWSAVECLHDTDRDRRPARSSRPARASSARRPKGGLLLLGGPSIS